MNLLEYKKNAITYLDLVYSEIVNYKKKLEEVDEKVKEGLYTRALYEQKQSEYKREAQDRLQSLQESLNSAKEIVLNVELEKLKPLLNKPVEVNNFAEIEMLKMLDYAENKNIEIFKEYVNKYKGNKLAEATLEQIKNNIYKEQGVYINYEKGEDLEDFLKIYISRVDSYVVQFAVTDYDKHLPLLEMYINGAKETVNTDYERYIKMKNEYK